MVELAIAVPLVLVPILIGMLSVGFLITDKVTAAYASRQGARVAAGLGNGQQSNPGLTTAQIDNNACQTLVASAGNLVYATVDEIDIYNASDSATANPDGSLLGTLGPASLYNSYDGNCNQTHGSFPAVGPGGVLDPVGRVEVPPNETSIGVSVKWRYTMTPISVQLTEYSVMRAAVAPG